MLSINQTTDTNTYFGYNDYNKKNAEKNAMSIFNHEVSIGNYRKSVDNKDIKSGYQEVTYKLRKLPSDSGKLTIPFVIYDKNNYKVYINGREINFYKNKYSQLQIFKDKNLQNIDVKVKYIVPMRYKVVNVVSMIIVLVTMLLIFYMGYRDEKCSMDN